MAISETPTQRLRELIQNQRVDAGEGWFIPEGSLQHCLRRSLVRDALVEAQFESWGIDELTDKVFEKAIKVFSILILIKEVARIGAFITHEGYSNRPLDDLIPFDRPRLEQFLPKSVAIEFQDAQWHFHAPVFSPQLLHQEFRTETIMPFTKSEPLGKGGFGSIYRVTVSSGHYKDSQGGAVECNTLARKQIDIEPQQLDEWKNEHSVMAYLYHLEHPCLLNLIATYVYRGKVSFLFPVATGGDLDGFLQSEHRPVGFESDAQVYLALSGLASALEKLHEFRSDLLGLEMMGYHRDLNPRNILVSGNRFILSDFGLSKLKEGKDSRIRFEVGGGFYLAPECEDHDHGFKKGVIGRSSDVWSFGCVLIEVVLFILRGGAHLKSFREDRCYTSSTSGNTSSMFFAGNSLNPTVQRSLDELSTDTQITTVRRTAKLIKHTLDMVPDRRLKARDVTARLRLVFLQSVYLQVVRALDSLIVRLRDTDCSFERARLRQVGFILDLDETSDDFKEEALQVTTSDEYFKRLECTMTNLEEWMSSASKQANPSLPVHFKLRQANDELSQSLSPDMVNRIRNRLESFLLSDASEEELERFRQGREDWLPNLDLSYLAAVRQMHSRSLNSSTTQPEAPLLSMDGLRKREPFQACERADYFDVSEKQLLRHILIEWVVYDDKWTGTPGDALCDRIKSITSFLKSVNNKQYSNFPCCGYLHDPSKHRFGIVYEVSLPSEVESQVQMSSVHEIIGKTMVPKEKEKRPLLGDVFSLAYRISASILELHKVSWLHKSFSSYNVIILGSEPADGSEPAHAVNISLENFRIIGFNYSRRDHPNEYTEGPWRNSEKAMYQHPEYASGDARFETKFDYYSFGLILLELGMWKTLTAMKLKGAAAADGSKKLDPKNVAEELLSRWVPRLGIPMGREYRDVVTYCLTGGPTSVHGNGDKEADVKHGSGEKQDTRALLEFEEKVVNRLKRCHA